MRPAHCRQGRTKKKTLPRGEGLFRICLRSAVSYFTCGVPTGLMALTT